MLYRQNIYYHMPFFFFFLPFFVHIDLNFFGYWMGKIFYEGINYSEIV